VKKDGEDERSTDEKIWLLEIRATLAYGLKALRKSLGLTQEEVAERIGSSQSRVAKMEAGHPSVTLDLLIRAHLGLGTDPENLGALLESGVPKHPEPLYVPFFKHGTRGGRKMDRSILRRKRDQRIADIKARAALRWISSWE